MRIVGSSVGEIVRYTPSASAGPTLLGKRCSWEQGVKRLGLAVVWPETLSPHGDLL